MRTYFINLLLLIVSLIVVELCCFVFFHFFHERFTFYKIEDYLMKAENLERAALVYDAQLGWKRRYDTPFGERPRRVIYNNPLMATFGDSFTHGDQVRHEETFQTFLSAKLQADVYNFATGGYGTDQAYLRFKEDFPRVKTPLVALGLTTENINRIVNMHRRFYYPKTALSLPKPRFAFRAGKRVLLQNPVQSKQELSKMLDPRFVRRIGQDDWWFNRDNHPILSFPYSRILANKRLWLEVFHASDDSQIDDATPRPWENLWKYHQPRRLMFSILDSFVEDAKNFGATPIVMLFPLRRQLIEAYQGGAVEETKQLFRFCKRRKYHCFNGLSAMVRDAETRSELDRYANSHLTPKGHAVFARRFLTYLVDQDLVDEIKN